MRDDTLQIDHSRPPQKRGQISCYTSYSSRPKTHLFFFHDFTLDNTIQYNTIQYTLNLHRGFSGPMKPTTKQQNTTTTTVKNSNWPEANQLAIYKCSWEVEPGTTRNKFNEWSERLLNPGSLDLKASALTTGPHCLHTYNPTWSSNRELTVVFRHQTSNSWLILFIINVVVNNLL